MFELFEFPNSKRTSYSHTVWFSIQWTIRMRSQSVQVKRHTEDVPFIIVKYDRIRQNNKNN